MSAVVTFDEARQIADDALRPTWPANYGTFMVADWGREDDEVWSVFVGAREALIDDQFEFELMDAPVWLVNKATGELSRVTYVAEMDRIDAMRPVGNVPT